MTYTINVLISEVFYCILLIIINDAMKLCIKNFFVDKIKYCGTFKSALAPKIISIFLSFLPWTDNTHPVLSQPGNFGPG